MGEGNSQHRSLNGWCVTAQYREQPVQKRQLLSAVYLNIALTPLTWEMETSDIPCRSRNKVVSSPYRQVFVWRKTPLIFFAMLNVKREEQQEKKKRLLFSGLFLGVVFFCLGWVGFFFSDVHPFFLRSLLPHPLLAPACSSEVTLPSSVFAFPSFGWLE